MFRSRILCSLQNSQLLLQKTHEDEDGADDNGEDDENDDDVDDGFWKQNINLLPKATTSASFVSSFLLSLSVVHWWKACLWSSTLSLSLFP